MKKSAKSPLTSRNNKSDRRPLSIQRDTLRTLMDQKLETVVGGGVSVYSFFPNCG